MRYGALVTRRFVARVNGREALTEVHRTVELGLPPASGLVLAFADGTPEMTISRVRIRVRSGFSLGLLPIELEAIGCKESAAGLEAALAAGWQRVAAPADAEPTTSAVLSR